MAAPLTFGTAFASAGFTVDPNFSPNNQQFANAVLAVCGRAGLPFGFEAAGTILAGPAAGAGGLPAYRALVTADLPDTVGTVLGVDAVMGGAGTSCGVWTNQHITTVGTATLTLNAFNGTLAGLVPSSSGGSTNYLRADGSYAQPPGTTAGANPSVSVALTGTNGVATTFMRSDAAPALDVSIAPTWTGVHTFSNASLPGTIFKATGAAGGYTQWNTGTTAIGYAGAAAAVINGALSINDFALESAAAFYIAVGNASRAHLKIIQSGYTFGNTTDNPTYAFTGTGAATLSGIARLQGTGAQAVLGTSTSYAWGTGTQYPIIQLAGVGSLYGTATTGIVLTGGGLYFNGTNYIYGQAGTGVIASLGTGSFTVSCVNTSGTAAGTATPTVVFSIGGTVTSNKIQGYGPVAAALVDMTPDTGTFNGTLASVTTVITCPCVWARSGNVVILAIGTGTGTSNANDFTLGGLPPAITPTRTQRLEVPDYAVENSGAIGSITTDVELVMNTNGTMTFLNAGTAANWGATLFKGVAAMFTVPYLLN